MEKIKPVDNNLKAKSNREKPHISNEAADFDSRKNSAVVNKEINEKQEIINNTINDINNIRQELGLKINEDLPPSVRQIEDLIGKLKNDIEYLKEIPIEKDRYYRVSGISELLSIVENKTLTIPEKSYYDRSMLNKIAKNSDHSIDDLELINSDNPEKIRELYKKYISDPNSGEGRVTIAARAKSNHGNIGFVKEGFFYNPIDKDSSHFGAPVIVGSEDKSLFESGAHGSRTGLFNEDIEPNEAVVLKEGTDAENFEYWLHEEGRGWYKNSFDGLQAKFKDKKSKNN